MGASIRSLLLCTILSAVAQGAVPEWVERGPGLYEQRGGGWVKVDWRDHKTKVDALLEHCCSEFRCPFDLPPGTTIVPGEDDKDLTRERTKTTEERYVSPPKGQEGKEVVPDSRPSHCGIDLGSRISTDGGATISTIASGTVSPITTKGFVRVGPRSHMLEQRVLCEHDGLQLVLQFTYGHVTPRPGLDQHWIETPRGRLGDLEVSDAWVSHDPQLPRRAIMSISRSTGSMTRTSTPRWRTTWISTGSPSRTTCVTS